MEEATIIRASEVLKLQVSFTSLHGLNLVIMAGPNVGIDTTLITKFIGANVGPIRGRQDPGGPHVGHMNFIISVS